jgi:long-chain acyl-CoA synthetase
MTQVQTPPSDSTADGQTRQEAAARGIALSWHAERKPDQPALHSPYGDRSFAELDGNANRLVRALRAAGLEAGDGVALVCRNRPEFVEVHQATQRSGLRLTTVNWHLTGPEMAYIVEDCEAKAVIADVAFADAVTAAVEGNSTARSLLAVGGEIGGFSSYAETLAVHSPDALADATLGRTMLYTSGTTGRPKGVERQGPARPAGDSALYQAIIAASTATPDGVHLCTGPLYHAAPLAFSLALPLALGIPVVLMDGWDAAEMLQLIERYRVTQTHVVPTMFHRLLSLPDDTRASHDVSSMNFILHGAAPCPVDVKKRAIDWFGPVIFEYYAATEGGGTFVTSQEWLAKPGTVGKPVSDDAVRIYREDGSIAEKGEIGTVYMKATIPFRYHNDEEKTRNSYRGDYFTVGDHGYLDEDGYLFLTGRIAELIISGGVNIYPAEVDAALLLHPAVADAGTIGVPDEEWGERVLAVVELRDGWTGSAELGEELIAWCRDRLAHYKCPRAVEFVDELPRHDNGKLYRQKLRQLFAG